MANKPLKTIKFPGLDDTYTIPQKTSDLTNDSGFQTDEDVSDAISDNIDDTLFTTGKSADAKAVGDKIAELEDKNIESYIANSASGSIASFTDGADDIPVKDLTFHISPIQDLHGYDHPWPEGGGKNLLKVTATTQTINGVTFTVNDDGSVSLSGTATADTNLRLFDGTGDFTNCIMSGCPSGGTTSTYYAALSNVTITSLVDVGTERVITIENTGRWIYNITIKNGYTANNLVFKPMIRLASVTDPTFEPYSNVCPISGWTEIEGVATGFNVWDEEWEVGTIIASTGVDTASISQIRSKNYIPVVPNTAYFYSTQKTGQNMCCNVIFYDADKNYIDYTGPYSPSSTNNPNYKNPFTTPVNCHYIRFTPSSAYGASYLNDICINLSDPSRNGTYEPYSGTTIPITLPSEAGTVYGGYVDVTEGKLVVDRASVDLGTLTWSIDGNRVGVFYAWINGKKTGGSPLIACSVYQVQNISVNTHYDKYISGVNSYGNGVFARDTAYSNAGDFKTSVNGQTIVYELATPIEYSLTPQQVNSLLGENHIWCDCGETEVEYRADTKLYIDGKIAELQALILENGGN